MRGRWRAARAAALSLSLVLRVPHAIGAACPNTAIAPNWNLHIMRTYHRNLRDTCHFQSAVPEGEPAQVRDLTMATSWSGPTVPHYEQPDWPKPERCKPFAQLASHAPWRIRRVPHQFVRTPNGELAFILVWKAGITTLTRLWACAYGATSPNGTLRSSFTPEFPPTRRFAGMVRDPISRLISAYGEILARTTSPVRGRDGRVVRLPDPLDLRLLEASVDGAAYKRWVETLFGIARAAGAPRERAMYTLDRKLLFRNFPPSAEVLTPEEGAVARLEERVRASAVGWLYAGLSAPAPRTFTIPEGALSARMPGGQKWPTRHRGFEQGTPVAQLDGTLDEAKRFAAFVRALECAPRYFAWQHAATQTAFMARMPHVINASAIVPWPDAAEGTDGDGGPVLPARRRGEGASGSMPLDITSLVRQEFYEGDLKRELIRARATRPLKKCRITRQRPSVMGAAGSGANAGEQKRKRQAAEHGFPSKELIRRVLDEDDELMRIVCRVFFQDFTCYGYKLPRACGTGFARAPCPTAAAVP